MRYSYFVVLLLTFVLLTGCQQTTTRYLGALADKDGAIALTQGETKNQQWDDLYISVDYSYKREGDHLGLKGLLSFTFSSQTNYRWVRDLKLKVFFLDKNLRVVEYFDIARTLSSDIEQQLEFQQTFQLPAGVSAFTFGYEGLLADGRRFTSSIWNLPKHNL